MTVKKYGDQSDESSQHQVFTLVDQNKSWRMINCSIPHRPCSNCVCIDSVVYYYYVAKDILDRTYVHTTIDLKNYLLVLFIDKKKNITSVLKCLEYIGLY